MYFFEGHLIIVDFFISNSYKCYTVHVPCPEQILLQNVTHNKVAVGERLWLKYNRDTSIV